MPRARTLAAESTTCRACSGSTTATAMPPAARPPQPLDLRIKVAGFGGQGVLMLGEVLAEAGWRPATKSPGCPPTVPRCAPARRTATCACRATPIDSPLVSRPNVLLAHERAVAAQIPARRVEPGGIVLYNGATVPEDCVAPDVRVARAVPFTEIADGMGASKVANIVMLGALLETTALLDPERVIGALRRLVKSPKWFDLDVARAGARPRSGPERRRLPLGRLESVRSACNLSAVFVRKYKSCGIGFVSPGSLALARFLVISGVCGWLLLAARRGFSREFNGLRPLRTGRPVGDDGWRRKMDVAEHRRDSSRCAPWRSSTRTAALRSAMAASVLGSDDGGKTWSRAPFGTTEKLMDVTFVGNEGWASGMNGTVIHTADGGRTWDAQKTGTSQALEGLFFLDAQHGWAVGWAGTILRTTDGGKTGRP